MATVKELLTVALAEVGYCEKKSNSNLDSKTENAGDKNFTKYSRDLVKWVGSPYSQGVAWCDQFVDWCFITAFGLNKAKELLGGWSAYTPTSSNYFKAMNRWYATPEVGDQIFFKNTTRICHTGIVTKVDSKKVYTIEGNTSSAAGMIANGGCVREKSYALNYKNIAGYGRPAYDVEFIGQTLKSNDAIANEVLEGKWGSGQDRKDRLTKAGYDYATIQNTVNVLAGYATKKTNVSISGYKIGTYEITATNLRVRDGATTKDKVIKLIPKGTKVNVTQIITKDNGDIWGKISTGYIAMLNNKNKYIKEA